MGCVQMSIENANENALRIVEYSSSGERFRLDLQI